MSQHKIEDNTTITEQIPDDMPDWAISSMANGTFFMDAIENTKRLYEYIHKESLEDDGKPMGLYCTCPKCIPRC